MHFFSEKASYAKEIGVWISRITDTAEVSIVAVNMAAAAAAASTAIIANNSNCTGLIASTA